MVAKPLMVMVELPPSHVILVSLRLVFSGKTSVRMEASRAPFASFIVKLATILPSLVLVVSPTLLRVENTSLPKAVWIHRIVTTSKSGMQTKTSGLFRQLVRGIDSTRTDSAVTVEKKNAIKFMSMAGEVGRVQYCIYIIHVCAYSVYRQCTVRFSRELQSPTEVSLLNLWTPSHLLLICKQTVHYNPPPKGKRARGVQASIQKTITPV